jgi:hypothetical protein
LQSETCFHDSANVNRFCWSINIKYADNATLSAGAGQSVVAQTTTNNTIQVDAGGGNATGPLTVYVPSKRQNIGRAVYKLD